MCHITSQLLHNLRIGALSPSVSMHGSTCPLQSGQQNSFSLFTILQITTPTNSKNEMKDVHFWIEMSSTTAPTNATKDNQILPKTANNNWDSNWCFVATLILVIKFLMLNPVPHVSGCNKFLAWINGGRVKLNFLAGKIASFSRSDQSFNYSDPNFPPASKYLINRRLTCAISGQRNFWYLSSLVKSLFALILYLLSLTVHLWESSWSGISHARSVDLKSGANNTHNKRAWRSSLWVDFLTSKWTIFRRSPESYFFRVLVRAVICMGTALSLTLS